MFFDDNSDDSDDLPANCLKEESITANISAEIDELLKDETPLTPWKQIADKFRKCLLANTKSFAIIEFLDSLLTFMRKGPKDSRNFTKSICNYLLATRHLASNEAVDECYYDHMKDVLVLYCLLELRLISCFDDDSMVASDILFKITLLMQGSNSTAILDVLIDIDEEIRGSRSISIMKKIYRKYLMKTLIGGQIELDDNNFIKHLIVFHSWIKAESNITEKANVLKFFLSAIKPSQQLQYNPLYSNFLPSYNPDEVGGYRRLLQETILRKNLILALRDAGRKTDFQDACENVNAIDLTMDDEPVIKIEVNCCLNLPNEVITIDDDDDDDTCEISYLQKLYEKLDAINISEQRLGFLQNTPIETIDIGSDSDVEINDTHEGNDLIMSGDDPDVGSTNSINNSTDLSSQLEEVHPNNTSNLKTYARTKGEATLMKAATQYRRKTVPINASPAAQQIKMHPILRVRSCTNTLLGNPKKVTFSNPPATTYVFERCDYVESAQSDQRISDSLSSYIVTGPQCNFPYVTPGVVRHTSPNSSSESQIDSEPKEFTVIKTRKSRKRKRCHNNDKLKRTSIDAWIKRKQVDVTNQNEGDLTIESKGPTKRKRGRKKNVSVGTKDLNNLLPKCKKCRVVLSRCNLPQISETNLARVSQRLSFNEDMTLKEIIEAKERMLTANVKIENSKPKFVRQSINLSGVIPVTIQNYFPPPSADSNYLTSPMKKPVKSPKKSSLLQVSSKSNSVIKSRNKKCTKRMESACKKAKKQSNNSVRPTTSKETVKCRDCFVLLENFHNISYACASKGNSSKKPQRRTNPMTKHCSASDTNFRLPTKSPQEYQFKRSFEKIPAYEKESTIEFSEIASPIITSVTSISTEELIANDEANQSVHHVMYSTSTTPQLEITLEPSNLVRTMFINQPSETISDVEPAPSTSLPPSPQLESTNEVDNCETLSSIKCKMKAIREVTSCSPDTTTSSTPQFLVPPDINDSLTTETIEESESNERATLTPMNCDKNLEKRLRMAYDDCDNDIPSPAYSPYEGKRKNDKISRSKVSFDFKSIGELVTPIDLRLKITNGESVAEVSEINESTNATISSSQSTGLIDELHPGATYQSDNAVDDINVINNVNVSKLYITDCTPEC